MAAPKDSNKAKGTKPPKKNNGTTKGTPKNTSGKSGGKASSASKAKGAKGVLNPSFDPRMRRIGSPLNNTSKIKRGYLLSGPNSGKNQRINFLFNPSEITLSTTLDPNQVVNPEQVPSDDVMQVYQTASGTTLNVDLLYDRTYELLSPANAARQNLANQYGVYADVAAWLYFHNMIDTIPSGPEKMASGAFALNWSKSLITQPMNLVDSYLYVGPHMVYYGFCSSLTVIYSHWSLTMIPMRCKISIGFSILPAQRVSGGPSAAPGGGDVKGVPKATEGWGYKDSPDLFQGVPNPIPGG